MCVTLQRAQSLRAWWEAVACFYLSLRCESQFNCLTDTRHRVNFSWQPDFSFCEVIELCTWALQRWHLYRHIRTRSRFTPVEIYPKRFVGLQMHTVVWMLLRLYKYLYLLWIWAYAPKAAYEQVQDIQKVGLKFPGFRGKKKNNPPLLDSKNIAAAGASIYIVLMENSISWLCSFQS